MRVVRMMMVVVTAVMVVIMMMMMMWCWWWWWWWWWCDDDDEYLWHHRAAASLRSEVGVRWLSDASSSATDVVELVRLIQCAAYNMLIAVISSTQSDLKFYAGFLFPPDNLAKVSVLWLSCSLQCSPSLWDLRCQRAHVEVVFYWRNLVKCICTKTTT